MSLLKEELLNPFRPSSRRPSAAAAVILAAMLSYQVFLGTVWVVNGCQLYGNDEVDYLQNGLRHRFSLQHDDHEFTDYLHRFLGYQHVTTTPPLLFDFWEIFWRIFGPSPESARGFSVFCLAIAGLAVFGTARRLAGDTAGLLAAASLYAFPPVNAFAHQASSFMPHIAGVAVVLYVLTASDLGRKPPYNWLIGFAVSADLLLERGTPPLILAPMLAFAVGYCVLSVVRSDNPARFRFLFPWFVAGFVTLVLAGWYLYGYATINMEHTFSNAVKPLFEYRRPSYYFKDFYRISMTKPMAPLLYIAFLFALLSRSLGPYRLFFPVAFFGPILIFSVIKTRDLEYVLGVLPVAAAAIGVGFSSLPKTPRIVPALLMIAVLAYGSAFNSHLLFGAKTARGFIPDLAASWRMVPISPLRVPNLKKTARLISQELPASPMGIFYAYSEPGSSPPDPMQLNVTQLNALQIYLAFQRPDDYHFILTTKAGTEVMPRPRGTQGIAAVPLERLSGALAGPGNMKFDLKMVKGGLFAYYGESMEKLATERFKMTNFPPARPFPGADANLLVSIAR